MTLKPIAYYHCPLGEKFGVPRQSGLAPSLRGTVEFVHPYDNPLALKGLEEFDRIWLIWGFSANKELPDWEPTVRPPRLGGNTRVGVFATRSPYRPNPLGLSCVRLEGISEGMLEVSGADLMDGTPIYDIKPYIPYADSHPGSAAGFVDRSAWKELQVIVPEGIELPQAAIEVLRQDPRPQYHTDPSRIYGLAYGKKQIRFTVSDFTLTVLSFE